MKKIYLTKGGQGNSPRVITEHYAMVSDEDYEYLNQWNWSLMSIYHTGNRIFYARRYEGLTRLKNYKAILMHRVILGLDKKEDKGDHIDGNGLNNQRNNLRCLTHKENLLNIHAKTEISKNKTSSGVIELGGKWGYVFRTNGKVYQKSNFLEKEDAEKAYIIRLKEVREKNAKFEQL